MNRQQLEHIVETCGSSIYSFCLYLTKDVLQAEELYQDTFLMAIKQDKIDFAVNPKSYLLGIRINLWRNHIRKLQLRRKKVNTVYLSAMEIEDIADNLFYVDDIIERNEIRKQVHNAVDRLEDKYKLPVLLFYMEELNVEQVANILKIPQGTVKSRLYKARKILERQLEDLI